jgi:hypothetical protein
LLARGAAFAICASAAAAVVFEPLLSSMTDTRKLPKKRLVHVDSKKAPRSHAEILNGRGYAVWCSRLSGGK